MKQRTKPNGAVTRAFSLYAKQNEHLTKRSADLRLTPSRFLQRLLEYDMEHNLIADILHQDAKEAAK